MKLSTKVLLALAIVIAVALVTAGLLFGRSAGNAYQIYLRGYQQQQLAQLANEAAEVYVQTGSWAAAQRWLDENDFSSTPGGMGNTRGQGRGPRRQGQQTANTALIVDAASGEPLAAAISSQRDSDILATVPVIIDGETVALLATEPTVVQFDTPEEALISRINQAILLSALAAGLVALGVGWLLVASILRPLRRLQTGVAQVTAGDLEARVEVQGNDEIAQLAADFNLMAANLHAQEALRQRLVADIAHELRTPLTVIQGNLQAILDGVYPLTLDEVRTVREESRLLSRLVSDLHELAQAEAGQLSLARQPVSVVDVLQFLSTSFRRLADEKGITITVIAPDASIAVDADPDRLHQILTNLLGNALRHTPEQGAIELSAEMVGAGVRLSVRNSGPGIDPTDLPHVFDRFYRGETSRQRDPAQSAAGSGLGLAIVKALVEAHDGEIGVQSEAKATTFWFVLRRATTDPIIES